MFFIGVGSGTAAAEFINELGIDPALCFGDEGGAVGYALDLNRDWVPY